MIGCEKLCGLCGDCAPLLAALDYDAPPKPGCGCRECAARAAIIDPSALAELLARALRGRCVAVYPSDEDPGDAIRYPCVHVDPDGDVIVWQAWTSFAVYAQRGSNLEAPSVRSAISRLLALPIDCGAEKALAALEST